MRLPHRRKERSTTPLVTVKLLSGRTAEQKKALAEAISHAVVSTLNVEISRVMVIVEDVPPFAWMKAGRMFSEEEDAQR